MSVTYRGGDACKSQSLSFPIVTKVKISEDKIDFHEKVLALSLVLRVTVGFAKTATGFRIPAKSRFFQTFFKLLHKLHL